MNFKSQNELDESNFSLECEDGPYNVCICCDDCDAWFTVRNLMEAYNWMAKHVKDRHWQTV